MDFIPFANCFSDVADRDSTFIEVPSATVDLPAGMYVLQEWYCLDNTCDCSKVIINVSPIGNQGNILASIGFGWESRDYYKHWAYGDEALADMMVGIHVELGGRQTPYTPYFLERMKNFILQDMKFTEKIKCHYHLFKTMTKKLSRNDPCPCGCGRKYKKHGIV